MRNQLAAMQYFKLPDLYHANHLRNQLLTARGQPNRPAPNERLMTGLYWIRSVVLPPSPMTPPMRTDAPTADIDYR